MQVHPGKRPPFFPLPPHWRAIAANRPGSILLETAGGDSTDHTSYLFTSPLQLLTAHSPADLPSLFLAIEAALQSGLFVAGALTYEAGYTFVKLPTPSTGQPLAVFGVYANPLLFDHNTGRITGDPTPLNDPAASEISAAAHITAPTLAITPAEYNAAFQTIQQHIAAGDTYQVNFTTAVESHLLTSPLALYNSLLDRQPTDFAAILHFPPHTVLSFSPELFFRIDPTSTARHILTRPMKGTSTRGATPAADDAQRTWLRNDPKNLAEHVMIVDMLRNDLGRVCSPGSVHTRRLFHIEPYPTLFQMTSEVAGTLNPTVSIADVFSALFPGGSVTGAPKRNTMQIIHQLEPHPRGIYTGAIGFLSPTGAACFSIPIRTLALSANTIRMGTGGGIVADSTASAEFAECQLKASFLQAASTPLALIETLLWNTTFPHLEAHLTRLSRSASELQIPCDLPSIRASLLQTSKSFPESEPQRVRLQLFSTGLHEITHVPLSGPTAGLRVRIARQRIDSRNPWLRHKTTRRALYDREFIRALDDSYDECLFLNERNELAEGCISNLFLDLDGRLCTPPLSCGLLPGIGRQHILATTPTAEERILTLDDLRSARQAFLCSALRGMRPIAAFDIE